MRLHHRCWSIVHKRLFRLHKPFYGDKYCPVQCLVLRGDPQSLSRCMVQDSKFLREASYPSSQLYLIAITTEGDSLVQIPFLRGSDLTSFPPRIKVHVGEPPRERLPNPSEPVAQNKGNTVAATSYKSRHKLP